MRRALVIFRKELKDTVRDRRTLVVMVLVPILLMPLILVGSVKLQEMSTRSQAEDVVQLMVSGGENAPGLVAVLADNDIIEVIESPGDAVEMLKDGTIDARLVIPDDFMDSIESELMVLLDLEINSTHGNSVASVDKVRLALDVYSEKLVEMRLAELEVPADVLNGVEAVPKDTATQKEKRRDLPGIPAPHVPGDLRHDRRDVHSHGHLRRREGAEDPGGPADDAGFAHRDRLGQIPGRGHGLR